MSPRSKTPRRRWSETFKKHVATEAIEPGMTVAQIARAFRRWKGCSSRTYRNILRCQSSDL
ncbi:MAG: transposase [Filomicrobium sp.]